jgi:Cu+-exporting ATPase
MEKMVPLNQVNVDDILLIKPGEKIPVDGQIIFANFSCHNCNNTIRIHSWAYYYIINVFINWHGFTSTMNTNGVITIMATKVGKDTALSNIIKVVEEAQSSNWPGCTSVIQIKNVSKAIAITIGTK